MLILTLRPNESVFIGEDIDMRFLRRTPGSECSASLSIIAPPGTCFQRSSSLASERTLLHVVGSAGCAFPALLQLHEWLHIGEQFAIQFGRIKSRARCSFLFSAPPTVRILRDSIAHLPPSKARRASA